MILILVGIPSHNSYWLRCLADDHTDTNTTITIPILGSGARLLLDNFILSWHLKCGSYTTFHFLPFFEITNNLFQRKEKVNFLFICVWFNSMVLGLTWLSSSPLNSISNNVQRVNSLYTNQLKSLNAEIQLPPENYIPNNDDLYNIVCTFPPFSRR